jgi:hypothetical protein
VGGIAAAWQAASGTLTVAFHFATGNIAYALHANDQTAQAFLAADGFLSNVSPGPLLCAFVLPALLAFELVEFAEVKGVRRRAEAILPAQTGENPT